MTDQVVDPLRFGVPANVETFLDVFDLVAARSRWLVALGEVISYADDDACPHRSDLGELIAAIGHELYEIQNQNLEMTRREAGVTDWERDQAESDPASAKVTGIDRL